MSDIIYTFKNNAYFNITNRCTCKCIFCIRNEHEAIGEATELWHDHNPSFVVIKTDCSVGNGADCCTVNL